MSTYPEFQAWPKIPRLTNEKYILTEKIDGTNACIVIKDGELFCQSRTRFITPEDDNFGFARWAYDNKEELLFLGDGYHFGEWWGKGIQRGYGLEEKRFSLFNTYRWNKDNPNLPKCCSVIPVIGEATPDNYKDMVDEFVSGGSIAAKGYMNVEGVVVFSTLTRQYYKYIVNK